VQKFFELKFLSKGVTILVPTNNLAAVGLRRLSSSESINKIFKMLSEPVPRVNSESIVSNWNKRNKEYQCRLRSGDLNEICKIYRDLRHIALQKELSFGEKNLLLQTEALLVEEISIVKQVEEDKTIEQLRALLKGGCGGMVMVMGN
jgi:CarD family transcriptional regulator